MNCSARASRRLPASVIVACVLLAPVPLMAQGIPVRADSALRHPDSLSTVRRLEAGAIDQAPADSADGPLLFLPGVSGSLDGISIRGASPGSEGVVVNGIDITPGVRGVRLSLPTIAVDRAWVTSGPLSARDGAGRALRFEVPGAPRASGARASYASDALMGASSLGFHRFEASGGAAGPSSRFFVGATLTGQKSADFGSDARDTPVFSPVGTDTTVVFAADPSQPSSTTTVTMPGWAEARGRCGLFKESADPAIASNFGEDCTGDRTPASARSDYEVAFHGEYDVNRGATLGVLALKSRSDARRFDYASLSAPANLRGTQQLASVYALTLSGSLNRSAAPGAYRLGISRQHDQRIDGPLTPDGEQKTRDPALGLMLGGLDFRWDFESFPVDTALVDNYRYNRPGTRISPLTDAEAAAASLVDRYRDGPYALFGFPESGGPVGAIDLFRESRTTGYLDVVIPSSSNSSLALGASVARHEISRYAHRLESSVSSDVWIEKPSQTALYAEQRFDYAAVQLAAGIRYDAFHSNADRTTVLDTLPTIPGSGGVPNPAYGSYHEFPRPFSYGNSSGTATINGMVLPLVALARDPGHHAWSPRLRASLRVGRSTELRAGAAREARMPDLALSYLGINTDLAVTNTSMAFGSDLDFERSWQEEMGLRHAFRSGWALDLVAFNRTTSGIPILRVTTATDPARNNSPADFLRYASDGHLTARGAEVSLEQHTTWLTTVLGYRYQDVRGRIPPPATPGSGLGDVQPELIPWERPHTLSALIGFTAPPELRQGSLARATLWLAFRWASGAAYGACRDPLALSDEGCMSPILPPESRRLPAERHLDIRFSKRLTSAEYGPSFFIDARNVLNFTNVIRAFRNAGAPDGARAGAEADQLDALSREADRNGARNADGSIALDFAPGACVNWLDAGGTGAAPNCVALRRAEARYGNGDGIYTIDEQRSAIDAAFDAFQVTGLNGTPRRIRIGMELGI